MSDAPEIVSVYADVEALSDEVAAVEGVFRKAGFDVEVNATYERRSTSANLPWIIGITLGVPITVFFTAVGTEAGEDVYAAVKAFVKDLWQTRARPDGSVSLKDPDGTQLILATRIPERAIDALANVDWSQKRGHYLIWDEVREAWRDPARADPDTT